MRKIYLASRSPARKKLLREIGIPFQVKTSQVRESRIVRGSCSALVIDNARRKAEDVARRVPQGVVIAADTVVLVGRRIIGKPRNIADAMRTLKLLSRKPQWVYSGIAVVDVATGRVLTASDRTKVYMNRLSDRQIKNYFKRVSPLDKAGSFDIQGLGGIFIDRIEGCYYNVVGLPLAKLERLLRAVGVEIF